MASTVTSARVRSESAEQLKEQSTYAIVSGLLLSVLLHGGVIALLLLLGWRSGSGGTADESRGSDFQQIGLFVEEPAKPDPHEPQPDKSTTKPARHAENPNDALPDRPASEVPQLPPAEMSLPQVGPQVLGPGPAVPSFPAGDVNNLVKSGGVANPVASLVVRGAGETSFFNIRDKAARVVYVIDRSESMSSAGSNNYSAMQMAKSELIASLNGLKKTQQFQVLFYNDRVRALRLGRNRSADLGLATEVNVQQAKNQIFGITAGGSTKHMRALRESLKFSPDAVFFLTDGEGLTGADLNRLVELNSSGARIHCVQFGIGEQPARRSMLERLSELTRGHYRYHQLKRRD